MNLKIWLIGLCAGLFALPFSSAAEDPAHQELRVLRTQMIEAVTKGDIDTVIKNTHPKRSCYLAKRCGCWDIKD
ncbi:MAG: hypothetical protein HC845_09225 [Akkermansiaceae bacterium]|nr:hypothetical protein [Akkermansiaceae bacterium]